MPGAITACGGCTWCFGAPKKLLDLSALNCLIFITSEPEHPLWCIIVELPRCYCFLIYLLETWWRETAVGVLWRGDFRWLHSKFFKYYTANKLLKQIQQETLIWCRAKKLTCRSCSIFEAVLHKAQVKESESFELEGNIRGHLVQLLNRWTGTSNSWQCLKTSCSRMHPRICSIFHPVCCIWHQEALKDCLQTEGISLAQAASHHPPSCQWQ